MERLAEDKFHRSHEVASKLQDFMLLSASLEDLKLMAQATSNFKKFEVVRRRVDDGAAIAFAQSIFANVNTLDISVAEILDLEITKTVQRCSRACAMGRRSSTDSNSDHQEDLWDQKRRIRERRQSFLNRLI